MKYLPIKALVLLITFLLASSCERDFDQTNTNPNNPEKVTPDLLLPTIMRNSIIIHYFFIVYN